MRCVFVDTLRIFVIKLSISDSLFYFPYKPHSIEQERMMKMIRAKKTEFDTACESIIQLVPCLAAVPGDIKSRATEIRLKVGQPLRVRYDDTYYITQDVVDSSIIQRCIEAFCRYSVHNYENDISNGFITLKGGHRAGFCGTAVYNGDKLNYIKNISSVNIRIAREHKGCAEPLAELFGRENVYGLLIAGKPLSGKTTLLRDLCRILGEKYRLSIIDERNEIAACYEGVNQLSAGSMSDIFTGFCKKDGIERAVRTMAPDYVVLDELGADAESIRRLMNCGVGIIMTIHAQSEKELMNNESVADLKRIGALSHIAVLSGKAKGVVEKVINV